MTHADEILERVLREILHEDIARKGGHPSPANLFAYTSRRLGDRRHRRIQEHLAHCPECARILLELESFPQPTDGHDERLPTEVEREEAWLVLSRHLPPERATRWQGVLAALASPQVAYGAAMIAVCAALAILFLRQPGAPAGVEPTARVAIYDLVPEDIRLREGESPDAFHLEPRLDRVVWILNALGTPAFPGYRIEVRDAGGRVLWQSDDVTPGLHGSFALELPAGFLPAGAYRIHLYGRTVAGPQLIARYNVQIQ